MTTEQIMSIISICSGNNGIHYYEKLTKENFIRWFKHYYSEEHKEEAKSLIDFLNSTTDMTYGDFNCKYNKCDYRGVIKETSIIDMNGNIIFHGDFDSVEDYWDNNMEPVWKDGKLVSYNINGVPVETTNYGHTDRAAKYFFSKLNFKVL